MENKKKHEDVMVTDGNFLDEMRAIEKEVLEKIDPEALKLLEEEAH